MQWSLGAVRTALEDVRDFTASVDQAGLYALVNAPRTFGSIVMPLDDPCDVLAHPDRYRGKCLQFNALMDKSIIRLELSRPRLYGGRDIYYAAGRIPFGENLAMPAVFLFPHLPLVTSEKPLRLEGLFYMVLRAQTQAAEGVAQNPQEGGPGKVDFLVFVVPDSPEEVAAEAKNSKIPVSLWYSVGGVVVLGLLWMILRKTARPVARMEVPRRVVKSEARMDKVKTDSSFSGRVVPVELGERSYPIYIGRECLGDLGRLVNTHAKCQRALVVTDKNVEPLYGRAALDSLRDAGVEGHLAVVDAGEASKSTAVLGLVYDKMFEAQMERRDPVIALGGGVVGDLAGYAAATFKRGVPFVQVPTTLLAMVDSSIGGKTAINHPRGKNMIGAFYQPRFVLADVATLGTLPERELGCGLAETAKHGVIRDRAFFDWLEGHVEEILGLAPEVMAELVERNCRIKAAVVGADEREAGLRGILNLGHTVGHALETVLKARDIHHGEAVSIGMVAALRLATGRGLLSSADADRIISLLKAFKLPVKLEGNIPVDDLYAAMRQDKKVSAGKITFVLPTKIGDCAFYDDVGMMECKNVITSLVE